MNRLMTQNSRMKAFFVTLMLIPSLHGMVVELTEEAPSILRQLERDGATPLHIAAYCDRVEGIEKLIAEGASIDAKNAKGATPLHFAAKRGNILAVQSLIAHKGRTNVFDKLGFTPLHYATQARKLEVIRYLLDNGSLFMKDRSKKPITPLHVAALNGDLPALECMVRMRAVNGRLNSIIALKGCSMSPLHCAAENGSRAVIDFLIQSGESVSARDKDGNTPLLIAARHGNLDALICLIGHGASLEEENEKHQKVLHCAAEGGHVEMLQILLDQGADINYCGKSFDGQPPVMWAFWEGHVKAFELLLSEDVLNGSLIGGLQDLLCSAAEFGSVEILKLLLGKGALINKPDYRNKTALVYAARGGHAEATMFLLEQGAHIKIDEGPLKVNALHEAICLSHVNVIKEMLASGADIELKDFGRTPLQYATGIAHPETIKLLIDNGANLQVDLVGSLLIDDSIVHNECLKILLEFGLAVNPKLLERALSVKSSVKVRMIVNAHPECITNFLEISESPDAVLRMPEEVKNAANDYYNKRAYYFSEKCFQAGDNPTLCLR